MIIDQKIVVFLLLYAGETNATDEQLAYCHLVITDPGGDLVEVFLNMWNDVVDARDTRTLVPEELDIPTGANS